MTDKEKWAFGVLFTAVVVALLWVCSGCLATLDGAAQDFGDLCDHIDQKITSRP